MPPSPMMGVMARPIGTHPNGMISNPNPTDPSQENNMTKSQE